MAANFGQYVYSFRISPDDVLIDTTIFPPDELSDNGAFPEEAEVILLPGTYDVEITEE